VLYVPQEGRYSLKPRTEAWRLYHGISNDKLEGFIVHKGPTLRLDRKEDVKRLEELIDFAEARLVVIDTLAVSLGDVDEDSATEMRPVLAALRELVKGTGATLLLVVHTGWNTKRERGSSALRSEADAVLHIEFAEGVGILSNPKQRNGIAFEPRRFTLKAVAEAESAVPLWIGVGRSIRDQILDALRTEPWTLTRTDVEERVSGTAANVRAALDGMVAAGEIVVRKRRIQRGPSGRLFSVEVYALAGTPEPGEEQ